MKKITIYSLLAFIFAANIFVLSPALAIETNEIIDPVIKEKSGLPDGNNPQAIAAKVINVLIGFLGIIAVAIFLYSGFEWMTAGGNEEKVTQARKRMLAAIIGLLIILSAFIITQFVIENALKVVS